MSKTLELLQEEREAEIEETKYEIFTSFYLLLTKRAIYNSTLTFKNANFQILKL